MSVTDICRLCLSKNKVVWVFDKRFENTSMKNVVFITTGVEICVTDAVSQRLCEKCCHIVLNMFEFRKKSLENDKHLKEQLNTTEVEIKKENLDIPSKKKEDLHTPSIVMHPTVQELYNLHPHLRLPTVCLAFNVKPSVVMQMDEIENYYKQRNLNFKEHCKLALKPKTTARKRTLASTRAIHNSPPCQINGQIIRPEVEDTDDDVLRPIKIKIIPKVPTEKTEDNISETESHRTEKITLCHKKRKYSNANKSPTKENEKPEETDASKSLPYVANLSEPLYTCNICDAVRYNAKDLKTHRNKHLRCQFCKSTFRCLESKTRHLKGNCVIKSAMNTIPCFELPKIETRMDIVNKYPKAFAGFSPLIDTQNIENSEMLSSESEIECIELPVKHVTTKNTVDIIEILSDDDDASMNSPSKNPKEIPTLTPDVKIKDSPILDCIDSNPNEVLKNLLNTSMPLTASEEKGIQTETLDPISIEVDKCSQTAFLPNLKQHMLVFRIPIVMKKGSFNVSYSHMDTSQSRNLQLWNDLIPLGVKKNNTKVTKEAKLSALSATVVGERACTPKSSYDENYNSLPNSDTGAVVSSPAGPINHSSIAMPSADSVFPSCKKIVDCNRLVNSDTANLAEPVTRSSVAMPSAISVYPSSERIVNCNSVPNPDTATLVSIPAEPVSRGSVVTPSASSVFPSSKRIIDSASNHSISTSGIHTITAIQWNPPVTENCGSYPVPQPNSVVANDMTSVFKDTSSTKHSISPTSASRPVSRVSTIAYKPIKFKISHLNKIRKISNTSRDTLNNNTFSSIVNILNSGRSKNSDKVTKNNCQRPQTPFVANNRKPSNAITSEVMQQSFNTPLNKNVAVATSSNVPLNLHTPTNVQSPHWQPSCTFTTGYPNVPATTTKNSVEPRYSSTVPQPVPSPYPITVGASNGFGGTPQSNYSKYVPIHNQTIARASSLPSPALKRAPPPPYHMAVAFASNNIHYTPPCQITNNVDDTRTSFTNPPNLVQSSTPQPFQQFSEGTRYSPQPLVSTRPGVGDTIATSLLGNSQIHRPSAQANGTSCSVIPQQFGHIRVKNMQELI